MTRLSPTPGPWEAVPAEDEWWVCANAAQPGSKLVAVCLGMDPAAEANARLIADLRGQRDELLEALERLEWKAYHRGGPETGPMYGDRVPACPACRGIDPTSEIRHQFTLEAHGHQSECFLAAALAKARGEGESDG